MLVNRVSLRKYLFGKLKLVESNTVNAILVALHQTCQMRKCK